MAFASRAALVALLALSLPTVALHASQAGESQAAQTPTIQSTTSLVLVDVVVRENNQLVHGLDKSKFHVFENGQEQPILTFDEHRAPAAGVAIHHSDLPPHTYTNIPDYPQSGAVNVLLLDGLNTPVGAQMDVRRQMVEYLNKIKPGTVMAVFTLTSRLRMVAGFTTDMAALREVIKGAKGSPHVSALLDESTNPQAVTAAQNSGVSGIDRMRPESQLTAAQASEAIAEFEDRLEASQTDDRVKMTLDAMDQLARSLSVIPGRKNVVWFSAGFPLVVFAEQSGSTSIDRSAVALMGSHVDEVRETTKLLADARVAIYPVDARGLMPSSMFDASKSIGDPSAAGVQRQMQREQDRLYAEHASMGEIAADTGGKAFLNTNDFETAIDEVLNDGWSYYTIGYAPAAKNFDGQFHTFQVRLDDKNYKLAYRDGYFADAPGVPAQHHAAQPSLVTAAMHGAPGSSQLAFDARILPATDARFAAAKLDQGPGGEMSASLKGTAHRYVVDMLIDPHTLRFESDPDGTRRGNLEIALVAYDQQGNRVNYLEHPYQMTIGSERFAGVMSKGVVLRMVIDLPEGQSWLRVAMHDVLADRTGALEAPVVVGR